ncbi:Gfo/Idh/MocA family protein [Cohnella sp. 56]|uniref:Gfo/Idh/MocA family protein n=1 Tax=Cohnella sp. 56 TaxID=3113722 RepID=UPI0030EA5C7B
MTYRVAVVGGGIIAEEHLAALTSMVGNGAWEEEGEKAGADAADQGGDSAADAEDEARSDRGAAPSDGIVPEVGRRGIRAVAVADLVAERAKALAERYGVAAYTDYMQMIVRERPDIAIITLPHYLHKEAALFCLAQGCHVLLEKPMALDVEECDEIIAAAGRAGTALLVGHTQHYIAENLAAKRIVDAGILGELVMIRDVRNVHYFSERRPAWFFQQALAGGGIMMNLGSHSIDKIVWFAGSAVSQVKAAVSYHGDRGDIEGSGMALLQLENGFPASLALSGYPGCARNETELVFTEGMLRLETGKGLWISRGGDYERVQTEPQAPPFVLQLRHLVDCIEGRRDASASLAHSRHAVATVRAIYASHASGREETV